MKLANQWFDMALSLLAYQFIFVPLCEWFGKEPYSPAQFGVVCLVMAAVVALVVLLSRSISVRLSVTRS